MTPYKTTKMRKLKRKNNILKHKTDIVLIGYYHANMLCFEDIVTNLQLKAGDCSFDIVTKRLTIHSKGLVLQPGDCYQYLFNKENT